MSSHSDSVSLCVDAIGVPGSLVGGGTAVLDFVTRNLGRIGLLSSALLCFGAAIGYAADRDWHRALHAFLLGCLEVAVTL
jgi:hypothetical protein